MHDEPFNPRPLAVFVVWTSVAFLHFASSSKILAVTTMVSPSHGIWNRCLLEALAQKGHQMTVLSPFSAPNKTGINYYNIGGQFDASVTLSFASLGVKEQTDRIWQRAFDISRVQIKSGPVKRFLVDREESFDLIILEMHYSESLLSVLPRFGVPVVAMNAFGDGQWNWQMIGAENYPSVFAQPHFSFRTPMKFSDRLINFISLQYEKYVYRDYLKKQQLLAYEAFGRDADNIEEAVKKIDFLLINSGPQGFDLARVLPPFAKEVGCLQCRPSNKANLEMAVRDFLDNAADGFVYMSLGTNVKSSLLPKQTIEGMLQVLGRLKLRVLWKYEEDNLPGKPNNVMIRKWLSQQDVLGHKNIRLFISHGGRFSVHEAVHHGVPLVVVPFYVDQHKNAETVVRIGTGVRVSYLEFTKDHFQSAIDQVLNEKTVSALARDRMSSPLEEAVFWIEHVVRNNGSKHLRPASSRLSFIHLHSLDVMALLLGLIFSSIKLLLILRNLFLKNNKEKVK